MKPAFLVGRLVYGGFFLYSGIDHFRQQRALTEYTASKGVPFPGAAVTATGAVMTLAGISILLGLKPKWGVFATAGFLAAVSPLMHDFWQQQDPAQRSHELAQFSKNIALLGAGLGLLGMGEPWPVSLPEQQEPAILRRVKRAARNLVVA